MSDPYGDQEIGGLGLGPRYRVDVPLTTEHDLYGEAWRRLQEDAVLRYRAELTARAVQRLRKDLKRRTPLPGLEDDRLIAAMALVVAETVLPGSGLDAQ